MGNLESLPWLWFMVRDLMLIFFNHGAPGAWSRETLIQREKCDVSGPASLLDLLFWLVIGFFVMLVTLSLGGDQFFVCL